MMKIVRRSLRLSLLVLAILPAVALCAPKSPPATPGLSPVIPSETDLAALDAQMKAGDGEGALKAAARLVRQNLETPRARGLGPALGRLAVAEAMLGREEDARWHWAVAQGLNAEPIPAATLAGLGPAGAQVAGWPVRTLEEVPPGVAPLGPAEGDFQPPRQSTGAIPELAIGTRGEPGPKWVRVQLVIDAEGHPRQPVASGPSNRFTFEVLEALRGWRFEPARKGGSAVAALHLVAINAPLEKPLSGMLGGVQELRKLEERLRTGKTEGVERQVDDLWRKTLDKGLMPFDVQAAILTLRALAYVGAGKESEGICFAQAAQGLHPPLFDADLSPYGAAGELLERNRYGAVRAARLPRLEGGATGLAEKPSIIRASQKAPRYTADALKHGSAGKIMVTAMIDENGAVRDPLVFGAGPGARGLDFSALEALCRWRFNPARLAGRPIPVYYEMTVGFDRMPSGS